MILGALWFFLPAGLANAVPVVVSKLPYLKRWNTPLDFGKEHKGQPIFGANKTWRGLLAGMVVATLVIGLQKLATQNISWFADISWIDYEPTKIWLLGPLSGAGALLGDAVESFFKRRRGTPAGQPWFPFDQIDYIIGGSLLSLFVIRLPLSHYIWTLAVWLGMHIVTVYVFYLLGVRDKPI
jgi:CDP-2,3-bis-(O-geranylgeranyl)-sn-glycerol synthase